MSGRPPRPELRPQLSPTWAASEEPGGLGDTRSELPFQRDLLYGGRGLRRPLIAVATKKELGPARHALSLMVVAGTMVVYPPLRAGNAPVAPADMGPRVLTFTPPPIVEAPSADPPPLQPPSPPVMGKPPVAARPAQAPATPKPPAWQRVDKATEVRELPRPDGKVSRVERKTLFRFDGDEADEG